MRVRYAWGAALVTWALAAAAPGQASAQEPPPVLVYYAPADAANADIHASLERVARQRGTVLVDLSPPAPARPEAPALLRRAIDGYHGFEFSQALELLDRAVAEAAATGAAGLTPAELSDLLLYRALTLLEIGDAARAWDDFVRAAVVDPSRQLDPVRFPPRAVETFQRAVEALASRPMHSLSIDAPSECGARVDAREVDVAAVVPAAPGEHYVRVECSGKLPYAARVAISRDAQTVAPVLRDLARPDAADAARIARERDTPTALFAAVRGGTSPTLMLRLLDAATGAERARVLVALGGARGSPADVAAAADTMIERAVTPERDLIAPVPSSEPQPWYRNPWVWGAAGVGAAVAAAVLLPFALDQPAATGFDAEVQR